MCVRLQAWPLLPSPLPSCRQTDVLPACQSHTHELVAGVARVAWIFGALVVGVTGYTSGKYLPQSKGRRWQRQTPQGLWLMLVCSLGPRQAGDIWRCAQKCPRYFSIFNTVTFWHFLEVPSCLLPPPTPQTSQRDQEEAREEQAISNSVHTNQRTVSISPVLCSPCPQARPGSKRPAPDALGHCFRLRGVLGELVLGPTQPH